MKEARVEERRVACAHYATPTGPAAQQRSLGLATVIVNRRALLAPVLPPEAAAEQDLQPADVDVPVATLVKTLSGRTQTPAVQSAVSTDRG